MKKIKDCVGADHLTTEQAYRLLDGKLTDEEMTAAMQQVKACSGCSVRLGLATQTRQREQQIPACCGD